MALKLVCGIFAISFLYAVDANAQVVPLDVSGVVPGPIVAEQKASSLVVRWPDEASVRGRQSSHSILPNR